MGLYDMITYNSRELDSLIQDVSSSSTACAHTNCSSVLEPVDHLFLWLVASSVEIFVQHCLKSIQFSLPVVMQLGRQVLAFLFLPPSFIRKENKVMLLHLPLNFQVLLHFFFFFGRKTDQGEWKQQSIGKVGGKHSAHKLRTCMCRYQQQPVLQLL